MENKEIENRQLLNPNQQDNWPETLKNPIYTPAFLREQIGKLMRVEFLIGTNNLVDRIGVLEMTLEQAIFCFVHLKMIV